MQLDPIRQPAPIPITKPSATSVEKLAYPIPKTVPLETQAFAPNRLSELKTSTHNSESLPEKAIKDIRQLQPNKQQLKDQWNEPHIYTFSSLGLDHIVKRFLLISHNPQKLNPGTCLFAYDDKDPTNLKLIIVTGKNKTDTRLLKVQDDGTLLHQNKKYPTPNAFLQALRQENAIPYFLIDLARNPAASQLLSDISSYEHLSHDGASLEESLKFWLRTDQQNKFNSFLSSTNKVEECIIAAIELGNTDLALQLVVQYPQAQLDNIIHRAIMCEQLDFISAPTILSAIKKENLSRYLSFSLRYSISAYEKLTQILKSSHPHHIALDIAFNQDLAPDTILSYIHAHQVELTDDLRMKILDALKNCSEQEIKDFIEQHPTFLSNDLEKLQIFKSHLNSPEFKPFVVEIVKNLSGEDAGKALQVLAKSKDIELIKTVLGKFNPKADQESLLGAIKTAAQSGKLETVNFLFPLITSPNEDQVINALRTLNSGREITSVHIDGPATQFMLKRPELFKNFIYQVSCFHHVPIDSNNIASFRTSDNSKTLFLYSVIINKTHIEDIENFLELWKSVKDFGQGEAIVLAMNEGNEKFLKIIEKIQLDDFTLLRVFNEALRLNDPQIIPFLEAQGFFKNKPDQALESALNANHIAFLQKIKHLLPQPKDSELDIQLKKGRLSAVQLFFGNKNIERARDLLIESSNPSKFLMTIFMNSKMKDIENLVKAASDKDPSMSNEYTKALQWMKNQGRLIARLPHTSYQEEIVKYYGKPGIDFVDQQVAFANKRYDIFQRALKMLKEPETTLLDVFTVLAQIGIQHNDFSDWRLTSQFPGRGWMGGRYSIFRKVANNFQKDFEASPENYLGKFQIETDSGIYSILHRGLKLTKVFRGDFAGSVWTQFHHTPPESLSEGYQEMVQVFDSIRYETSDFKRRMAFFYWLAVQIMVTSRGNSQYCLEIYHLLHEHHGYKTSPVSLETMLPDCLALFVDFETFYTQYYDKLFEKPAEIAC